MPKKKKKKREFEPFEEEIDQAVESDLIRPLEKQLPLKWQKELEKDVVVPLKRRHILGITFIIVAAAIFSTAIIGFDVATPGTMNPFIEDEPAEPLKECVEIPPINLVALTGGAQGCDVDVFDADGYPVDAGWSIQDNSLVITDACLLEDYTIRIKCGKEIRYEDNLLDALADMLDGEIILVVLPEKEPEKPPATVFPGCEHGYDDVNITANEVTNMGACFREREEYNACIAWGMKNGHEQEVPSYELTLAYYYAAQRCAVSIEDRELSAEIEGFVLVYDDCWRLPSDSNYYLMGECFVKYEVNTGHTWSNSTELIANMSRYEALGLKEIEAYNTRMSAST